MKKFTHFIHGKPFADPKASIFVSNCPHSRRAVAEIALGDAETVDRSIRSNLEAFAEWRDVEPLRRGRILIDIGRKIRESADMLGKLDAEQAGKVPKQGPIEVEAAAQYFEFYGGLTTLDMGAVINNGSGYHAFTMRVPYGAIGVVTPWNVPLNQSARGIAPALAAGNVVTCKPSEYTSGTAVELAKIAVECGLPPGVLNVVLGTGAECGKALVSHPDISKVTFTGSVRTGQEIGHIAADRIIPLTLELGGKSANIIFEDADIDLAIKGSLAAFTSNAGQICSAGSRLLVARPIYDEVVKKIVVAARKLKIGSSDDADVGAITTEDQFRRIQGFFAIAEKDGARLECGGADMGEKDWGDGAYIPVTIYSGVTPTMRIAREEIFGPVLGIIPFDTEEDAIEIANDSDYGLAAGLWTENLRKAHRVAASIDAGYITVNHYDPCVLLPFGGFKKSGYGREKGIEALHHYCQIKSINIKL
ncbi:aldehyde dehydrogenase family protein [Sphingorhabdus sp. 109]|uniref:aldehyde dehydrogenase family protein n=1 Tax=Sphingorhabdus sp. 109 TaxID=2653173 RepID=UPI0012F0DE1E|nr:aldehyde dehydrogenase family protein [Sphingorhabdus sp. 109]VWX62055.1 Aldehyde dehydrogenase [Sphingorhabdus sp. 109]